MQGYDRVKVFSATKARDRDVLGERVTEFLRGYEGKVMERVVTQSSDNEFHCLTITLFCKDAERDTDGRVRHQDRKTKRASRAKSS